MSKNKVALGIAAAVVGITGVAGASVAVKTSSDDHGHQADVAAEAGGASLTGAVGAIADLPALPAIPDVNGLVNTATGLLGGDMAGGALAGAQDIINGAVSTATGMVPVGLPNAAGLLSACAASAVPLPAAVPFPAETIKSGLAALGQVESLTGMISGLTANLPIKLPTLLSAADVFNAVRGQINCAGGLAANEAPLPALCDIQAGLPIAIPEPVAGVIRDVVGMTGQTLNASANAGIGANCQASAITGAVGSVAANPADVLSTVQDTVGKVVPNLTLPKVDLPALPVPALPAIPGVGEVGGALTTVTDVVGTVNSVVSSLPAVPNLGLDLNGLLSGILPTGCSANASGGLLGSLTAVLSANCS